MDKKQESVAGPPVPDDFQNLVDGLKDTRPAVSCAAGSGPVIPKNLGKHELKAKHKKPLESENLDKRIEELAKELEERRLADNKKAGELLKELPAALDMKIQELTDEVQRSTFSPEQLEEVVRLSNSKDWETFIVEWRFILDGSKNLLERQTEEQTEQQEGEHQLTEDENFLLQLKESIEISKLQSELNEKKAEVAGLRKQLDEIKEGETDNNNYCAQLLGAVINLYVTVSGDSEKDGIPLGDTERLVEKIMELIHQKELILEAYEEEKRNTQETSDSSSS